MAVMRLLGQSIIDPGTRFSKPEGREMIVCWQCKWFDCRIWWDADGRPCMARCMHPDREGLGEGEEKCSCFEEDETEERGLCLCLCKQTK